MLDDTLSTLIFITGFLRTFNRYIITMDSQAPLQIHLMRISGGGTQALLFFLSFPGGSGLQNMHKHHCNETSFSTYTRARVYVFHIPNNLSQWRKDDDK